MEKPKVLVDLDEYNELIKLNKLLKGGDKIAILYSSGKVNPFSLVATHEYHVMGNNELTSNLVDINRNLNNELTRIGVQNGLYRDEVTKIKNLSIYEFIKQKLNKWKED